ncbi:MAG: nucleoside monophosphate kinase [Patescibacteria group bacterium]
MSHQFIILGPQGSGKGTQGLTLAAALQIPHVSTGDVFRDHIARGTALGQQVSALLAGGQLAPDNLTNQMVADRLAKDDAVIGFVLDGYPRNLRQAEFLHTLAPKAMAIVLTLLDDEAVRRIAGRRTCSKCGAVYHMEFNKPRTPETCDACGGVLVQRSDDTESIIRDRLATYHRETEPLLAYYRHQGRLIEVDGTPSIAEVTKSIRSVVENI